MVSISANAATTQRAHRKTVVLGTLRTAVPARHARTILISLNATGRRLLANRHTLNAKLTLSQSGHVVFRHAITFKG